MRTSRPQSMARPSRSEERRVGKECRREWCRAQAEDGIRDHCVTGVQTCALPISQHDQFNNPLTASGGTVVLSKTGGGTLSGVTDNHDGTYSATLTAPTVAGNAHITATVNGAAVEIGRASCRERV